MIVRWLLLLLLYLLGRNKCTAEARLQLLQSGFSVRETGFKVLKPGFVVVCVLEPGFIVI